VLGFYLSGHPLNRYQAQALRAGAIGIGDLGSREEGSRVSLFGLPGAVKEISTKNGDRMAFLTLEDANGAIEVTIFPETYRNSVAHLRSGQPIVVRGKLEASDEGRRILAEEIRPIEISEESSPAPSFQRGRAPTRCRILVAPGEKVRDLLAELKQVCRSHSGPVPLYLHLRLSDGPEVVIQGDGGVRDDPALVKAVERLVGQGTITFE